MTFFRREPLVGCFVFFHFSTEQGGGMGWGDGGLKCEKSPCSTLLLPVLQLVFNCSHSNQLQVFLQKYRGTGYKKNDQKGKGQTVKMALPVQSFLSSLQEDSSCVPFSFPTIIFLWRHLEHRVCIGILLFHIPSGNYHLLTSLIPSAMVRRPSLANWKVLCIEATNGQNRR